MGIAYCMGASYENDEANFEGNLNYGEIKGDIEEKFSSPQRRFPIVK